MSRRPTVLLDADVLCHHFAYRNTTSLRFDEDAEAADFTNPKKAVLEVDGYIEELRDRIKGGTVLLILSCRERNFRKELDVTYKAQRTKPKPELWYTIRDHIEQGQTSHPVISYPRLEGDDVIGILHTGQYRDRSIMVSIDKDMQTIPGLFYNPNRADEGVRPIDRVEAHRFHLFQTLTGDTTDNYKGVPGVGPKRAEPVINSSDDPEELWRAVVGVYESKGMTEDDAIHQARLAFILWDGHYNQATRKIKLWHPKCLSA